MKKLYRLLSRISIRILAFNLLLVFLPFIGILSLETYENELLRQQERSMVQQARILAAALGTEPNIAPQEAEEVLVNLERRVDARLRIFDHRKELLADSSVLGPRLEDVVETGDTSTEEPETRENLLYRLGSFLYRLYARGFLPPEAPRSESDLGDKARSTRSLALDAAFEGRYGKSFSRSPTTRSLTLYSAIPVRFGPGEDAEIIGAVLVSKSTYGILIALYDLRLATFKVVLSSVLAAIVLSLLVSTTIVRPIQRLRHQAQAILDRRGRLKGRFQGLQRSDEIGDLSRSLAELTRRLEGHIRFIESFASDVSHEFKNPLAAIRNATELLAEVEEPQQRQRFFAMILSDIARLEHLLSSVREITQIDAQLGEDHDTEAVDIVPLLLGLVERFEIQQGDGITFERPVGQEPLLAAADPDRLAQVFENLLDNAVSFSPPGGVITIRSQGDAKELRVSITDQGCGVPEEHRDRIFDRFFSYRAQAPTPSGQTRGRHTGLGLSIVRAIVENYGGSVQLLEKAPSEESQETGATFLVALPRAK